MSQLNEQGPFFADNLAAVFVNDPAPAAQLVLLSMCKQEKWAAVQQICSEMLASPGKLSAEETHFFLYHSAEAYRKTGQYELCIAACSKALEIEKHIDTYVIRMSGHRRLGHYPEALADCDSAIALAESDGQREALQEYRKRIQS